MFTTLERRATAVEGCESAIRHAIVSGDLPPGSRLPPERKLAESFGVNRVTVRSALSRLAASNLLAVRQGSGYLVQDFRAACGPELLPELLAGAGPLAATDDVVADLLLVRRQLARAALLRLRERADADGVAAIAAAVDAFDRTIASRHDDRDLAAADLGVLAALLAATGSAVLQLCLNPVLRVVASVDRLRRAIYAAPETNVAAYRLLLAWLADDRGLDVDSVLDLLAARDAHTLAALTRAPDTAPSSLPEQRR